MARAISQLLPPIERVKGNAFNVDVDEFPIMSDGRRLQTDSPADDCSMGTLKVIHVHLHVHVHSMGTLKVIHVHLHVHVHVHESTSPRACPCPLATHDHSPIAR